MFSFCVHFSFSLKLKETWNFRLCEKNGLASLNFSGMENTLVDNIFANQGEN